MDDFLLPVGYAVHPPEQLVRPDTQNREGRYVTLSHVNPERDVDELFECSHGSAKAEQVWTYMPYGPFGSKHEMKRHLKRCAESTDPLFFTVTEKATASKSGIVSYLNIVEAHQTIELGHIWYSPRVQQTMINTETIFLMLCESFDRLKYRRVEWKCNALNAKSRVAAQRLGFSFEGIFYKHFIHKNRNRDTAWFAMLDDDWRRIKANFEAYLYADHDCFSLRQTNQPFLSATDTGEASQSAYTTCSA